MCLYLLLHVRWVDDADGETRKPAVWGNRGGTLAEDCGREHLTDPAESNFIAAGVPRGYARHDILEQRRSSSKDRGNW